MDPAEAKALAANAALEFLPEGGVVGLGSGSTARLFIDGVGKLVQGGRPLVGVPTSEESAAQARSLGIPLLSDAGPWEIDVCVDGADEVSDELDLIKGGGACQTREKIVNQSSKLNVIVVDESKLSAQLGTNWAVPLEVLPFGVGATVAQLESLGPTQLRLQKDGQPWMTDAGNFVYDVQLGLIADPRATDVKLHGIPGIVETGIFAGRADVVLVAGAQGVQTLRRSGG